MSCSHGSPIIFTKKSYFLSWLLNFRFSPGRVGPLEVEEVEEGCCEPACAPWVKPVKYDEEKTREGRQIGVWGGRGRWGALSQ